MKKKVLFFRIVPFLGAELWVREGAPGHLRRVLPDLHLPGDRARQDPLSLRGRQDRQRPLLQGQAPGVQVPHLRLQGLGLAVRGGVPLSDEEPVASKTGKK